MDKNLYLIKQFESLLIKNGSKKLSKNFISFFFNKVRQKNEKPLDLLNKSISNIKPSFLIKVRKKGKRVVHVPKPIIWKNKRISLGIKNILLNSKKASFNNFLDSCEQEVINSSLNRGFSKKQQQDLYKIVLTNRSSITF